MLRLDIEKTKSFMSDTEMAAMMARVKEARDTVMNSTGAGSEYLGWRDWPKDYDRGEFARIKTTAAKIQGDSDILVVIGIGGSYLGARAVIELLGGTGGTGSSSDGSEIIFAGKDLSETAYHKIERKLAGKNWSINMISKSGGTLEPSIAFDVFRQKLIEQYGLAAANQRIYATTDANHGTLHDLTVQRGYEKFVVPDDMAGRYSVLSAVGLLPIAVAGIDIDSLMNGAQAAMNQATDDAMTYAAVRNILYEKGFRTEIMAHFDPSFGQMGKWWQQLFGESEGKDGRGILPDSIVFTTDLHSLGQYLQDGPRGQLFETLINIEEIPGGTVTIPGSDDLKLGYLKGKRLLSVNQVAYQATLLAHSEDGTPVLSIHLPEANPHEVGYFIYFMELAAAISAYTLGVNPFNQPGVESYKKHMFKGLGRPEE